MDTTFLLGAAFVITWVSVLMFLGCRESRNHPPRLYTEPEGRGYSQHNHHSRRLLQKAKDQELADFVQQGNAAWAEQQLASYQVLDAADRIEDAADTLLMNDPFNF